MKMLAEDYYQRLTQALSYSVEREEEEDVKDQFKLLAVAPVA